jgi:hypothetical protein
MLISLQALETVKFEASGNPFRARIPFTRSRSSRATIKQHMAAMHADERLVRGKLSEIKRAEIQLDRINTGALRANLTDAWMTVPFFRSADPGDLDPVRGTSFAFQPSEGRVDVVRGKEHPAPARGLLQAGLEPACCAKALQTRLPENPADGVLGKQSFRHDQEKRVDPTLPGYRY